MAKPREFDQIIGDEICDRLTNGESLRKISCDEHMPAASTIYKWLTANKTFAEQYAHAREAQADTLADEILDIADDGSNDYMEREDGSVEYNGDAVSRSKLRVDSRKWIASKLKPKKYGDKQLIGSDPDNPLPDGFNVRLVKAREGH